MPVLILDADESEKLVRHRKADPGYRWDEVWEGVYVVPPLPDILHSELSALFVVAFHENFRRSDGHRCGGHVNVSDRKKDWMFNVRCPDAVVYLVGNSSRDRFTHWQGGPDLLVEVAMPGDRSRDKLEFYASIGTREVLILDRDPWLVELYQLRRERMRLKGIARPGDGQVLSSSVGPVAFQLVRSRPRPKVRIIHTETSQEWVG